MGRNFIRWWGVLAAAGMAVQPAEAGDRKTAPVPVAATHHAGGSVHSVVFAAQARASADNPAARSMNVAGRGDLPFGSVSPFEARLSRAGDRVSATEEARNESGPARRRERSSITFFRFGSKLGEVSVQPVVGGVNGAQLSLGF
jgi:hypothetical protein